MVLLLSATIATTCDVSRVYQLVDLDVGRLDSARLRGFVESGMELYHGIRNRGKKCTCRSQVSRKLVFQEVIMSNRFRKRHPYTSAISYGPRLNKNSVYPGAQARKVRTATVLAGREALDSR